MVLPIVIIYQVEKYRRLIPDVNRKAGKASRYSRCSSIGTVLHTPSGHTSISWTPTNSFALQPDTGEKNATSSRSVSG